MFGITTGKIGDLLVITSWVVKEKDFRKQKSANPGQKCYHLYNTPQTIWAKVSAEGSVWELWPAFSNPMKSILIFTDKEAPYLYFPSPQMVVLFFLASFLSSLPLKCLPFSAFFFPFSYKQHPNIKMICRSLAPAYRVTNKEADVFIWLGSIVAQRATLLPTERV